MCCIWSTLPGQSTILKLVCCVCGTNPSTLGWKGPDFTRLVSPNRLFERRMRDLPASSSFCINIFFRNCIRRGNLSPHQEETGKPIPVSALEVLRDSSCLNPRPDSGCGPLQYSEFLRELSSEINNAKPPPRHSEMQRHASRWAGSPAQSQVLPR